MKSGYQQFFKQAKQVAKQSAASGSPVRPQAPSSPKTQLQFRIKPNSQEMAVQLRERLKKKNTKKPAKKIPWKFVGVSVVGVVVAFFGLNHSSDVDKYLKKVEFSLMGVASAEEKAPAKDMAQVKEEKAGEVKSDKKDEANVSKKEYSDEEINHFAKMNERKRELDAREEELNRMETELAAQKVDLEKRMNELDSTRRQISSILDDKVKADDKKVDALVQVYTNMKPQQAAKIFETMDEDLAIEILGRMKRKPAAEVLNLLKAEKAQTLSEKYAGYKKH